MPASTDWRSHYLLDLNSESAREWPGNGLGGTVMAMQEEQRLLRIGDVILLYYDGNRGREQEAVASDNPDGPGRTGGYVFSELRRYV